MKHSWPLSLAMAAFALGGVALLRAQYPGHVATQQKPSATSTLRAIGVLEWTGDRNHPNATRLVPVSLFDGEHLQDGALYLARPVPLALDSGTEYEVQGSGVPQGWFDIDGAREIGSDWFGFGKWKPYVPPPPKKLHPSRYPPIVVHDKSADSDKPHFVRRDQSNSSTNQDGNNQSGTTNNSSASTQKSSDSSQASSDSVDPDRPKLRRRPDDSSTPQQTASEPQRETPSAAADADRPRLSHGIPADIKNEPKPLEEVPVGLGQAVAVSDANSIGTQTFAFEWAGLGDAGNAQKDLEAQAVQLLAAAKPADATANTAKPATTTVHRTPTSRTGTRSAAQKKPKPLDPASLLTDARFHAFALTYGGGATLVLTAREASSTRSIAVIALQDIYGKVQVLWHSITDDQHLDVTPRMTLVDAVDPRGDGRANLLFEERNTTDRRFVLYAVGADTAQQVFATDPLPLHPVTQSNGS
jgi:hypothetical protein